MTLARNGIVLIISVLTTALICTDTLAKVPRSPQSVSDVARRAKDAFFKPNGEKKRMTSRMLAQLADKRITESSGIAASRTNSGVLWTHNDSGDGPFLFAVDRQGKTLARYMVPNAANVDWEEIAIGPGRAGKPAIYIGDIGDNSRNRAEAVLYRVPEPEVNTSWTMREMRTESAERFSFRYPDGAHNAETLLVHPRTGEVFIVTKEENGVSGVYRFSLPLVTGQTLVLTRVATVTFKKTFDVPGRIGLAQVLATGGAFAPDGQHVVIRTYLSAFEWTLRPGQSLSDALRARPRSVAIPLTMQGEAICYRPDGKALLLTSEGVSSPLWEVPLSP